MTNNNLNNNDILINNSYEYNKFYNYINQSINQKQINSYVSKLNINMPRINKSSIKKYKLSELFEIIENNKTNKSKINKLYKYPLIGNDKSNNGCINFVNTFDHENLYTCINNGEFKGYIFYHPYKFSVTKDCIILNKIFDFDNNINLPFISYQLNQIKFENINSNNFNEIEIYIYN